MPRPKGPQTKRIGPSMFLDEYNSVCMAARRLGVCPTEFVKLAALEKTEVVLKKAA